MEPLENKTHDGFILLGFSDTPHLLLPLLFVFLAAYILCITGNNFITVIIVSQPQLYTPMYVVMGNLAFVDMSFTTTVIPSALYGLMSGDTCISTHGCFAQQFLFLASGNMNRFLLAVIAFDRYCAVCFPLRYLIIMDRTCICLVVISWVLAYSQMKAVFIEGPIAVFSPLFFILGSYLLIIRAVQSSQGRWKTFSTRSSHLTMVILFFSTTTFMYYRPSSLYSPTYDRVIGLVYRVSIPMLNPFIYSLRNKDVKAVVKKFLQ
uniref:G-protein coupled receptors family 1 profile domain-containing protein n=1 Tax=Pyxicephalus adspersus TaxID=30357 RepID=A0AAV3AEU7_PYXAD|nr:TPA: hypothetical protein GDO54_017209 [Pyxicephalus adspersus]